MGIIRAKVKPPEVESCEIPPFDSAQGSLAKSAKGGPAANRGTLASDHFQVADKPHRTSFSHFREARLPGPIRDVAKEEYL